jgi:hypothetical protein
MISVFLVAEAEGIGRKDWHLNLCTKCVAQGQIPNHKSRRDVWDGPRMSHVNSLIFVSGIDHIGIKRLLRSMLGWDVREVMC